MIRLEAGKMRGVRVMPDPNSILLNSFEYNGSRFGYVVVTGEGEPAVFDGKDWHSVLDDGSNWETDAQQIFMDQMQKLQDNRTLDPAYEDLLNRMMAGVA